MLPAEEGRADAVGKGEGDVRLYDDRPSGAVTRARELRRAASPVERRLLRGLCEAFPHLKWRHQVPIGPFYADLLCFSEKLVIEVDGETHAASVADDTGRTAVMNREGYRVLRVANTDVMQNLEGVISQISFSLREKEGAPKARKDEGERAKEKGAPA